MDQQLSSLVHLHSQIQQDIARILATNSNLSAKNAALEAEIEQGVSELDTFVAVQSKQTPLAVQNAQLGAEKNALDAFERRVMVADKRVASLQLRIVAVVKEHKERNKMLLKECAAARERFEGSFQGMQIRKRVQAQRLEEKKASDMRIKVVLAQIEEERIRVEAEIKGAQEQAVEMENRCKEWMEAIASIARARRNARQSAATAQRQRQPKSVSTANRDEHHSVPRPPSTLAGHQGFDVVKAFREQQQHTLFHRD